MCVCLLGIIHASICLDDCFFSSSLTLFFSYFAAFIFLCLQTVGWIEGVVWTDLLHIRWAVIAAIWGSHQGSCSWKQRAQDGEWTTGDQSTKVRSISRIQLGMDAVVNHYLVFATAGLTLSDCHGQLMCDNCTLIVIHLWKHFKAIWINNYLFRLFAPPLNIFWIWDYWI